MPFLSFASRKTSPLRSTNRSSMCQRLRLRRISPTRLNPQDRISDCIDEQIVPAHLIQDENIEMNLEENDELVQPFLLRKDETHKSRSVVKFLNARSFVHFSGDLSVARLIRKARPSRYKFLPGRQ